MAAQKDQISIVEEAVKKSNEHTDRQLAPIKDDVGRVKKDVGEMNEYLHTRTDKLESLVTKSETDITQGLSKVGKPDPPEKTDIVFSLWPDDQKTAAFPVLQENLIADKDGIFTLDYMFKNASSTPASNMDLWIQVSDECEFAAEPAGFERLAGMSEQVRHKVVPLLNPGTAMEKQAIKIKTRKQFSNFSVEFRYSCATSGKPQDTKQQAKIWALGTCPLCGNGQLQLHVQK